MARKILLADDSVTAQNMGRKILVDAGYEVITVNNGSAALKKVNEVKPDLIVLDVYMPGYSGLEVCQRLKDVGETARIPILLTVGKLEPFKPEEAKRARADAFIVKPFEASELLSALSKLEDKVVPRPEPHKPGRFARAIAAVEEGRYDKSMAVEEDVEGWKNRIKFPSKKKEKAAEKDQDPDEFYNPVNKDLRTTVDHPPLRKPEPVHEEAPRVDLGALAQGLPKDVTPEEIAALAAAAAQIKGMGAGKPEPVETPKPEAPAEQGQSAEEQAARPAEVAAVPPQPTLASEPAPEPVAAQPVAQAEVAASEAAVTAPVAAIIEEKIERKPEPAAAEIPQEAPVAAPIAEAEKKTETPAEKPSEAEAPSFAVRPSDEVGAPASFVAAPAESGNGSGNGLGGHAPADEPMTMAAATGTDFAHSDSRWMAVPVALLPEEAALSLEQEMQKSHAALAAAEAAHPAAPAPVAESQAVAVAEAPVETAAAEPSAPATEGFMPEVTRTMSNVATAAADAIKAAVKEFEHVAASLVESKPEAPPEPVPAESKPELAVEAAPVVEAKAEEPAVESKTAEPEAVSHSGLPEPVVQDLKAEPKAEETHEADEKQKASELPQAEEKKETEPKPEEPQPVIETAVAAPAEISSSVKEPEAEAPVAAAEVPAEPAVSAVIQQITESSDKDEPAGGIDAMAKKEQEVAANTAAAWASWRRIRETGSPKDQPAQASKSEAEDVQQEKDEAAMAVAAGAEKAPEEVKSESEGESAEIASIVDSVLADMRPKIVAEISRKMGKKK